MAQNRATGLNVRVLEDKEVLFNFGSSPAIDRATGTFIGDWHSGGLEPADSTWALSREVSSNATNLTGGQTATSYTAGAVTSTVDLIPGSPALRHIEWPEEVNQNGTLYLKHSSKTAKAYVARVHQFASGVIGIMVSRERADLTAAERSTTTDPTARTVTATYKNGDDEYMFEQMYYVIGEDGTVAEVTPKVFQDVTDVQAQIDAGTAFVPSASEDDLTAYEVNEQDAGDATLHEFVDPSTGEGATQPDDGGAGTEGN